jgi:3',5'-cyclic AMP phosphodiesterase CpdA
MRLLAISDLHLGQEANRRAVEELAPHPDDWLIVAGDVGEGEAVLHWALERLMRRFARVLWVPGNHDLWTPPGERGGPRGEERYRRLVEVCREHGVDTPEDPWPVWTGPGPRCRVALLFTLYDYGFRPPEVAPEHAVAWASESGVVCADELLLHPDPHDSLPDWCAARVEVSEARLAAAAAGDDAVPLVLVNHWPLRQDLVHLRRIPRFSIWCGTPRSEDWHVHYGAITAVHGHLHIRASHWRDGVLFHEVSFGYARVWDRERCLAPSMRRILPVPDTPHALVRLR